MPDYFSRGSPLIQLQIFLFFSPVCSQSMKRNSFLFPPFGILPLLHIQYTQQWRMFHVQNTLVICLLVQCFFFLECFLENWTNDMFVVQSLIARVFLVIINMSMNHCDLMVNQIHFTCIESVLFASTRIVSL